MNNDVGDVPIEGNVSNATVGGDVELVSIVWSSSASHLSRGLARVEATLRQKTDIRPQDTSAHTCLAPVRTVHRFRCAVQCALAIMHLKGPCLMTQKHL